MFKNEIQRILSESEVFRGLTGDDLEIVSKYCQKVTFKEKDTLIQEGQPASAFNIVVKEQLKVVLPQEIEGRREHRVFDVKLNVLKEGDCFGEYSIIDNLTQNPHFSHFPLINLSKSEFLVRQAKPARSSWLKSQPGKVSRPSVPSFASMRVIVWVKRKQGDSRP